MENFEKYMNKPIANYTVEDLNATVYDKVTLNTTARDHDNDDMNAMELLLGCAIASSGSDSEEIAVINNASNDMKKLIGREKRAYMVNSMHANFEQSHHHMVNGAIQKALKFLDTTKGVFPPGMYHSLISTILGHKELNDDVLKSLGYLINFEPDDANLKAFKVRLRYECEASTMNQYYGILNLLDVYVRQFTEIGTYNSTGSERYLSEMKKVLDREFAYINGVDMDNINKIIESYPFIYNGSYGVPGKYAGYLRFDDLNIGDDETEEEQEMLK